jgi:hypothetical protein
LPDESSKPALGTRREIAAIEATLKTLEKERQLAFSELSKLNSEFRRTSDRSFIAHITRVQTNLEEVERRVDSLRAKLDRLTHREPGPSQSAQDGRRRWEDLLDDATAKVQESQRSLNKFLLAFAGGAIASSAAFLNQNHNMLDEGQFSKLVSAIGLGLVALLGGPMHPVLSLAEARQLRQAALSMAVSVSESDAIALVSGVARKFNTYRGSLLALQFVVWLVALGFEVAVLLTLDPS